MFKSLSLNLMYNEDCINRTFVNHLFSIKVECRKYVYILTSTNRTPVNSHKLVLIRFGLDMCHCSYCKAISASTIEGHGNLMAAWLHEVYLNVLPIRSRRTLMPRV